MSSVQRSISLAFVRMTTWLTSSLLLVARCLKERSTSWLDRSFSLLIWAAWWLVDPLSRLHLWSFWCFWHIVWNNW
jgi:hypothetical protein